MKIEPKFLKQKHAIALQTAKQYINAFREKYTIDNEHGLPYSETFNKQAIVDLLNQTACVGLRIFSGLKEIDGKSEVVYVLMGVDESNNTIENNQSVSFKATKNDADNEIVVALDDSQRHPPYEEGGDE